ncbi:MAG: hypothetical protein O9346_07120 [Leptospiraceae bacterium]|nr:hypothetical protein [Leptospiraceae bacterium]
MVFRKMFYNKIYTIRILILLLSAIILSCSSSEVLQDKESNDKNKFFDKEDKPALLRLSYYLAFRPPPDYKLLEKGDVGDKGNRYKISFSSIAGLFSQMIISTTNTENRSRFNYSVSQSELDKAKWNKYFYLKVQDEPNKATLTIFSCKKNLACIRWEWVYKGFLVVFESEGELPALDKAEEEMINTYHTLVEKHLLLY